MGFIYMCFIGIIRVYKKYKLKLIDKPVVRQLCKSRTLWT